MKKVKVKVVGDGKEFTPYTVKLPHWVMAGNVDVGKMECEVLIPDDEVLSSGKINQKRIREKYKENWSGFNASSVEV